MQPDTVYVLCQQLTDERHGNNSVLQSLQHLKQSFSLNFGNVKLKSVFTNVANLVSVHLGILDNDILLRYVESLIDYLGRDRSLDLQLLNQLTVVLKELKLRNETGIYDLVTRTWKLLSQVSLVHPPFALFLSNFFKSVFEREILGFFDDPSTMDHYVILVSDSPELFQKVTSILNEILIRSEGHEIILRLIASFVGDVMSICQKKKKNFLSLYPPRCCRLVSLLFISPELFPTETDKSSVTRDIVLNLIRNMYVSNRKCALMLLSHYQDWIHPFNDHIKAFD